MNGKWITAAAVVLGGMVMTSAAHAADETEDFGPRKTARKAPDFRPATGAVELTVATGYAQGFGRIAPNMPKLGDLGLSGGGMQMGVGYRVIPNLTLGMYGSFEVYARGPQLVRYSDVISTSLGLQADWHFAPEGQRLDPWVSVGTGWRAFFSGEEHALTSMHGMQLAKLQLGLDYRLSRAVALSPVIGAELTTFLTQATPTSNGFKSIDNPYVDVFAFVGFMARFDIPTRRRAPETFAGR